MLGTQTLKSNGIVIYNFGEKGENSLHSYNALTMFHNIGDK